MKVVSILLMCGLTIAKAGQNDLRFPNPPRQHAAWKADANIPTNIFSAAETLFSQGFPDPRGCEYREIEVEVSSVWNSKKSAIKTRGWILPVTKAGQTNRFAICWNGLIYPITEVLAPVDSHSENTNVISPERVGRRANAAAGEAQTVLFSGALSTRILLLMRSGEAAAALTNWFPNERMMVGADGRRMENTDPYLEFASDWAWALFDRAICSHMRGDEALALATARELAEVQPKIEAECARRGFPRQKYWDSSREGKEKPYLDFLEQFPQLLSDLERRSREGDRAIVIPGEKQKITNQTERIAALIRDLDLVQARQWGQPGGVNLAEDSIMEALIQEGDAAVDPLLDCMEKDKRLTRSVGFHRDFFRDRRVIPVSSAAATALQTILHASFRGNVAGIRAYWEKYRNLKLEDRWYAMLGDDAASNRWLEAAGNIIQPENETTFPNGFSMRTPTPTNVPVRLRGEILRGKSNPSVADLMARRALEVPAGDPNTYDLSAACQMGTILAVWDVHAAGPVAQVLSRRCRTVMQYSAEDLGKFISQLALVRAHAGDPLAFEDYAAWLPSTTPEHLDNSLTECLQPLREFPTNPMLQQAADKTFNNTNSAWSRLPWTRTGFDDPAASALVNLPAFRTLLVRELDRKEVRGSISLISSGMIQFEITDYMSGSRSINLPPDSQVANGTHADLRWCDWIALSLSTGNFIPPYNPFAPIEERNAAIEKAKTLLSQK